MRLISVHADGSAHRLWPSVYPTHTRGAFVIPPNQRVEEADGSVWSCDFPVIALFWPKVFYQVFVMLMDSRTDYYANVITPPLMGSLSLTFVDLDLDVIMTNGRVELVDEEEFDDRKSGYPLYWREEAMRAASELRALAKAAQGPFRPALATSWRAYVTRLGLTGLTT